MNSSEMRDTVLTPFVLVNVEDSSELTASSRGRDEKMNIVNTGMRLNLDGLYMGQNERCEVNKSNDLYSKLFLIVI